VRKAQVDKQPMFNQVPSSSDQLVYRIMGANQVAWNFAVELQHAEGEAQ